MTRDHGNEVRNETLRVRRCAVKGLALVIALVIASAAPSWAEELPKGTYSLKCWEGGVFAQVAYCTALFDGADEAR